MRRNVVIILMLLLGGAMANGLVAWGLALWHTGPPQRLSRETVLHILEPHLPGDSTIEFVDGGLEESIGLYRLLAFVVYDDSIELASIHKDVGLPFHAMSATRISTSPGRLIYNGVFFPDRWKRRFGVVDGHLPLQPLWPGFIANTLFYAALLWLLLLRPFALRRLIRRRRGLCERCAYPIGESPVCTECGVTLRSPTSPSAISAGSAVNPDAR